MTKQINETISLPFQSIIAIIINTISIFPENYKLSTQTAIDFRGSKTWYYPLQRPLYLNLVRLSFEQLQSMK